MNSGLLQARVRHRSHRALTVRTYDAFLGEGPRVDVAPAIRARADEMLLFHRVRGDELVRGPVDSPRDEAFVERFPEELLRLEARPPESPSHDVQRPSPRRRQPTRARGG